MSQEQASRFCEYCRRHTLAARQSFGILEAVCHTFLILLTVGFWIPVAGLHLVVLLGSKFRCQTCGK